MKQENQNNAENNNAGSNSSNGAAKYVWVVYFIGFDDTGSDPESTVEARVGYERIETTGDDQQLRDDAEMAALCRGGHLIAVIGDDDKAKVEEVAQTLEKSILRLR